MVIGIDIDDTLTNTKELQIKYWKEYYNHNKKDGYSEKLPKHINDWGDKYIETFWDTYRESLSFDCSFKKNTSETINKLKNKGHTLCIVTSRPDSKYQNLKKRINKWFLENKINIDIIHTSIIDKGKFCKENNIDLLIDNDINHIVNANNYKVKTILFNKDKNYKGLQTTDWKELYNIIKTL